MLSYQVFHSIGTPLDVTTWRVHACRTTQLNKQLARVADRQAQETSIKSKQNEVFQGNRIISMSDSGNHQYRTHIFPLDTFSFSIKDGFKGRASSLKFMERSMM